MSESIAAIAFFIPGNPKALKRHRTVRVGKQKNFVRQYDPSESDKKDFLVMALNNRPSKPIEGPIYMELKFVFSRPKSHYRTGQYSEYLKVNAPDYHTVKPDTSNLVKFVEDALNGVFWKDDSQICISHETKTYGEQPGIHVHIKEI